MMQQFLIIKNDASAFETSECLAQETFFWSLQNIYFKKTKKTKQQQQKTSPIPGMQPDCSATHMDSFNTS